ncbi:MAG: hypothetical protein Q7S76_02200 [bacterium]|nr:hypothetical protein [bacterium]
MTSRVTHVLLLVCIGFVLLLDLHLGLIRHFDPDEFAHLHWSYLIAKGYLPYRDFFFYIPPTFHILLSFLFRLPSDAYLLIIGRVIQFSIIVGSLIVIRRLTRSMTTHAIAPLLAMLLWLTTPVTFDKSIEIRPDHLMMLFLMSGMYLLGTSHSRKKNIASGFLIGIGFAILPKAIFTIPAVLLLLCTAKKKKQRIGAFAIGAFIPLFVLFCYFLLTGLLPEAVRSMTHDSFVVQQGKTLFSLWTTLSPWPLVYVAQGGVSMPWIVNTVVFIAGLMGLPLLMRSSPRIGTAIVLLLGGAVVEILLFPVPYTQYFLLVTPFLAISAGVLGSSVPQKIQPFVTAVLALLVFGSFGIQYRERITNTNKEQLGVIDTVLASTQADESIYDAVGSYVFRPDGYYFCCHPYAEFFGKLGRPYPTLRESLITTQTKFLVLDQTGQSLWKPMPEDLVFLLTHFLPTEQPKLYRHAVRLACSELSCSRLDLSDNTVSEGSLQSFTILADAVYRITTESTDRVIVLDGQLVRGESLFLTRGTHTLSPTGSSVELVIGLDRLIE